MARKRKSNSFEPPAHHYEMFKKERALSQLTFEERVEVAALGRMNHRNGPRRETVTLSTGRKLTIYGVKEVIL